MLPDTGGDGIRFETGNPLGNGARQMTNLGTGGLPALVDGRQQLGERVREGLDALILQFLGDGIHRDACLGQSGQSLVGFVQAARERDGRIAMVAEGVQRGGRHSVDRIGADQVIDVDRIGVSGILGAGRRPQRTLHARAVTGFERRETRRGKGLFEGLVGQLGIGDGRQAAQWRILGQARIDLAIDARDEERGHRGDLVDGLPCRHAVFEAAQVSLHHFGVALQREDQSHVDIDARGNGLTDGGDAFLRGGDFDHQVWAGDTVPKLLCLLVGAFRIAREERADFQADIAVAAAGLVIERTEQVGGGADVFDGQLPEDLLRVPARPGQRDQGRVVIVGLGDGVVEDGRVGGHAADIAALDHGLELTILQETTLDVVVPKGLAEGG